MLSVLVLALGLWLLGRLMRVRRRAQGLMLGLLYAAVLAINLTLPEGSGLRAATGGSAGAWLVLGGLVGLVVLYRAGLARLRVRVRQENRAAAVTQAGFGAGELERTARHIVLREIGGAGQRRLKEARVLVIGAGGLGAPALMYLGAAGVGTIGVIDDDVVEATNLQRQVIHTDARIGMPKVFSAEAALTAQNPYLTVRPYHRRLTEEIAAGLFADYDLILDGTDDTDTRYLANRVAVAAGVPLVSGAISQWEGQVSVFDPARSGPCYQCIFPEPAPPGVSQTCAAAGVLGPLPGIIGSVMAAEAIKVLTGAGEPLRGRMMIHDALYAETRMIHLERRADCPICGSGHEPDRRKT